MSFFGGGALGAGVCTVVALLHARGALQTQCLQSVRLGLRKPPSPEFRVNAELQSTESTSFLST
jgi:hypothetical protein